MTDRKEPPQSLNAEQAVIGSILKDRDALDKIIDSINNENYFYHPKNRLIFRVIFHLYQNDKPYDLTTVAEELSRINQLDNIGGRLYLIELIESVPSTANVKAYADIIAEKAELRNLINICDNTIRSCYELKPIKEISHNMDNALLDLTKNEFTGIVHIGVIATDIIHDVEHQDIEKMKSRYIETRIADLNKIINGIHKENLTIIGAPPSMGKTSFALDIPLHSKCRCLYVGLDETARDAAMRVLTSLTGITSNEMSDYKVRIKDDKAKMRDLTEAAIKLGDYPFYLCDRTGLTVYQIRALARQHQRRFGLDMLIIDYIQQIADDIKREETRNLEVTKQIRVMKDIAKEMDIAVVGVSQINREYAARPFNPKGNMFATPQISDLRDSGTIEQEANQIIFVWNLAQAAKNRNMSLTDTGLWSQQHIDLMTLGIDPSFIDVAKNKNGPKQLIPCQWDGRRMRFYSGTGIVE